MQKTKFKINNLNHSSSALLIEKVLENQPGIIKAKVDYESKKGVVVFDEQKRSEEEVLKTIEDINNFKLEKIEETEEENIINNKKTKHMDTEKQSSSTPKVVMAMAIVIIAVGLIAFGKGGKSGNLSNNNSPLPTDIGQQQNNQPTVPQNPTGPVKVSVDDDAVMGDKNAPVTLIEFVDYECPFCKSFFQQTLPSIKKDYIDTGKLKLVVRDFPLSFHANAKKESEAAECAREQGGGDAIYLKYHDQIFNRTTSNGTGLALTQLPTIAKDLGLNVSKFQQCLDSGKFGSEVDKDTTNGSSAGVSGTPSFFVGKSTSDGVIDGTIIVGAQPYSSFQTLIDQMLSQ